MNTKIRHTIIIIIIVIICCILLVFGLRAILYAPPPDYTIETEYGDSFSVFFDGFSQKSRLYYEHNGSESIVVKHKISKDEIVGLCNDPDLTAYKVDGRVLYDFGNGFSLFDGKLETNTQLIQVIKQNLLSDFRFFKKNTPFFLDNEKYKGEISDMLSKLIADEYDELIKYGLNIDDKTQISLMQEYARSLLS
jgi:hypothetical protein